MTFDELFSLMTDEQLSYDVKKIIYEQSENIQDLERFYSDKENSCNDKIDKSVGEIYDKIDKSVVDIFDEMNKIREELYKYIYEIEDNINEQIDDINNSINDNEDKLKKVNE